MNLLQYFFYVEKKCKKKVKNYTEKKKKIFFVYYASKPVFIQSSMNIFFFCTFLSLNFSAIKVSLH